MAGPPDALSCHENWNAVEDKCGAGIEIFSWQNSSYLDDLLHLLLFYDKVHLLYLSD
jgi:hypothetical protein